MVALNFDRARPETTPQPERGRRAPRLVARQRDAPARRRADVHGGDARRPRRGAARARRGVAHRRLATDSQPRDDRREPRYRVARGRRAAAAARRGRGGRGRERPRCAADAARRVPRRREAQRARGGRAHRCRSPRPKRSAADVHEGRAAQRDGHRGLLARGRGRSRAWRAARGLRVVRTDRAARHVPDRRSRRLRGSRRRRGGADRRRAWHRRVSPPRPSRPHPRALERCLA